MVRNRIKYVTMKMPLFFLCEVEFISCVIPLIFQRDFFTRSARKAV